MSKSEDRYEAFAQVGRQLADVRHARSLLSWDQETFMPPRGVEARARSLGTLAGLAHEKVTAPDFVDLVRALAEDDLEGDRGVNVRELSRVQERSVRVPRSLVVELAQTESLAHEAWVEARRESDFARFQPWLEKVVDLKKQVAHAVGFSGQLYDALLDEYEPYTLVADLDPILRQLRQRLVPLVEAIREARRRRRTTTCCTASTTSASRRPSAARCWPTSASTCRRGGWTWRCTRSAPARTPATCG